MIDEQRLHIIMPKADAAWVDPLNAAMARFNISTPKRELVFLAQLAVESKELTYLEENLNYTTERIMEVWPHRFSTPAVAAAYAHDPQRLANTVYAYKLGNGDEATGDGWRYRGRGPMQITGADNYRTCGRAIGNPGIVLSPDIVLAKDNGALSAAWFFCIRGCNEFADLGNLEAVRDRINGPARLGLQASVAYFNRGVGTYV